MKADPAHCWCRPGPLIDLDPYGGWFVAVDFSRCVRVIDLSCVEQGNDLHPPPRRDSDLMGNALALRRLLRDPPPTWCCARARSAACWRSRGTWPGRQAAMGGAATSTNRRSSRRISAGPMPRRRHACAPTPRYTASSTSISASGIHGTLPGSRTPRRCSRCGARPRARPNLTAADLSRSMLPTTRNARTGDRRGTVSLPSGLLRTAL